MNDCVLNHIVENTETTDKEKISLLWEYAKHLSKIYDDVCESSKQLSFFNSVIAWRQQDGYKFKIDQLGDEFKETFWKPDGDGVEAHSEKGKDLVETVELLGVRIGALKTLAIIRNGYEANGLTEQTTKSAEVG